MNKQHILAIACGLMATNAFATEAPQYGEILDGINMYTPEDTDPQHKITANEKYGTQWALDLAYGYWHTNGADPATSNNNLFALLHSVLTQRIIEDTHNGGTWVRAEFSGSWGLDNRSAASDKQFVDGIGDFSGVHSDIYGPHTLVIPELSLMHYFKGKRACVIAGMVNLTNYFDCVSPANDSFHSFANNAFVNSTVLYLPAANLGAVFQYEIDDVSYAMVGFSRETTDYGYNPFNSGESFLLVGEYGRTICDDKATIRINPFFRQVDEGDKNRQNAGIAASIEYTPCDNVTFFARTGIAAKQDLGAAFDFSCGATYSGLFDREDDFVGIALGVFKGTNHADEPTIHNREYVIEAVYNLQINDYLKIRPHLQYIKSPAYSSESDAVAAGVQAVFSF